MAPISFAISSATIRPWKAWTPASRFCGTSLPPLSLHTDAAWRRMAELTYQPGADGRFHPVWDTRIARSAAPPAARSVAAVRRAGAHPVLLVRGDVSNILLPGTVSRMRAERPDMTVVELPGIGHAPVLTEPIALSRGAKRFWLRKRMRLARFIAAGFGTGYAPLAAGTVASAAAVVRAPVCCCCRHGLLVLAALLATSVAISRSGAPRSRATPAGW